MTRDLRPLFAPRSLAIVGASADPSKWGNVLARGALRGAHRRTVFLVSRSGGEILGERVFPSLEELPEAPELAVLAVPVAVFEDTVAEALAVGARALVGISAGFGEHDEEGRRIEAAVVERVRAAGAVLLGPNCLGVSDAAEELDLGWNALPQGPIAFLSQSGNLALELGRLAQVSGLGFSRFASLGNQADLVAADFLADLASHEPTRAIALYVEDFRDGRRLVEQAARATERGTPVLLLGGGTSRASAWAALSHTGALVSDARAVEAACRAAGIVSVTTPRELVDAAQALLSGRFPRGRRVAVYADGGGHGVIATDVLAAAGFDVPPLSGTTTGVLRELLPPIASVANPIDFAGGDRRLSLFADVGRLLLESGEVDATLFTGYFGGWAVDVPERADEEVGVARQLARVAAESGRPLVVHTCYPESPAAAALRLGGVPVYGDVGAAVAALALLADRAEDGARPGRLAVAELPPVAAPEPGYASARAFLAEAGVPLTDARSATTVDEALAGAEELGYPVALKAGDLVHKSDAGGVVLGIADHNELGRAFDELRSRLGPGIFSVESMAPVEEGVELIVGAKRDPRFGPIVLAGLGGVYAEILSDVSVALAPVAEEDAERLIMSLRATPLLEGARGRAPLDVGAAAQALAAVSRAVAACDAVEEIDVNPLLVLPDGAVGLDARVVLAS